MTSKRPQKAPTHLKLETKRWWLSVVTDWHLEPHHVRLLTLAGEAWDRAGQARDILATDGLCVRTRLGETKAHPAAGIERDSRLAFARLVPRLSSAPMPTSRNESRRVDEVELITALDAARGSEKPLCPL
jgi:phage terminase small subunit